MYFIYSNYIFQSIIELGLSQYLGSNGRINCRAYPVRVGSDVDPPIVGGGKVDGPTPNGMKQLLVWTTDLKTNGEEISK